MWLGTAWQKSAPSMFDSAPNDQKIRPTCSRLRSGTCVRDGRNRPSL